MAVRAEFTAAVEQVTDAAVLELAPLTRPTLSPLRNALSRIPGCRS